MSDRYGIGNALVDIIAAPSKALQEVRERVSWLWVPLITVLLLSTASQVTYLSWVDFDWLVDQSVAAALQGGSDPDTEAAIRQFMQPGMMIATSVISTVVIVPVFLVLQATYLHLVNKVAGKPDLRFGQWFALSSWSAFPTIFLSIATFVVLALAPNRQLGQEDISPLSLQSLLINAEPGSSWATWGTSITLVSFWTIALLALGIMRWAGASALKAGIIAIAPYVLVFGAWALVIS